MKRPYSYSLHGFWEHKPTRVRSFDLEGRVDYDRSSGASSLAFSDPAHDSLIGQFDSK